MAERRRIAVLTTGRQDYGILRSTIAALRGDPRFECLLWAGGMHLRQEFGYTVAMLRADGFEPDAELDFFGAGAAPSQVSACALTSVSSALERSQPDALLLLGDRYETLAAGFAAALKAVPIVHLHGGEETEGAVDNALRHSLTKLSHLHLVSHTDHAARVVQMGEAPEDVIVVGAGGLDNLFREDLPTRADIEERLGCRLRSPVVVTTLHPTTLGGETLAETRAVAAAMEAVDGTYVVTQPNSDAGGAAIREFWQDWARNRPNVVVVDALGERHYWALLRSADAVLGNSSSGLIEAPAAGVPVVNVGDRQRGRLRSGHVVDVPVDGTAIANALTRAIAPGTRAALARVPTLYPSGPAAPRIIDALWSWRIPSPPRKVFHELLS